MEFSRELRARVLSGDITVTFRLWRSPKVKVGGRYQVGPGQIEVDSIEQVTVHDGTSTTCARTTWRTASTCTCSPKETPTGTEPSFAEVEWTFTPRSGMR